MEQKTLSIVARAKAEGEDELKKMQTAVNGVSSSVDKSSNGMRAFHTEMTKMGNTAKQVAKVAVVAFTAVTTAAVAFGVSAVKSYTASEDAIAGLEAGLRNTGEAVAEVSATLQKQATALQKVTKFSDEEIISADAMLTTFQLQGSTIEKLTPSLLDMAEGLRDVDGNTMSLSDAAKMMGKVMGNAEGGVDGLASALSRNGVILSEQQKEIFSTGTELERVNTLTEVLSYNFGGRALAAGKTYSGQMKILANQFDDVKESIGFAILKGIQPLMDKMKSFVSSDQFQKWLTDLTNWLQTNLPIAIIYVTDTLLPALKKIFDDIWPSIQTVLGWMSDLIEYVSNNTWVIEALAIAFVAVKTAMFLTGAQAAFEGVMTAAGGSYATLAAAMASPIILTVAVGAALAAIALVYNAAQEALSAMDGMNRAQTDLGEVRTQAAALYQQQIKDNPVDSLTAINAKANLIFTKASANGLKQSYINLMSRTDLDQATKDERAKGLFSANNAYASGTNFAAGGMALVGEKGPEIVNIPRGSQVIPNNKISGAGQSGINVSVSVNGNVFGDDLSMGRLAIKIGQQLEKQFKIQGTQNVNMLRAN